MARDLSSNSSPYEFENMLPLDVLAAVASETLRNEIHTDQNLERKVSSSYKRPVKKSHVSVMTFEDVKSLPVKALVEKFSEMTSDELRKKYFCKCLLIPPKCSMIFKSFGNEKKACDEIKSHLLSHLQQLSTEYESNRDTFATVFVPKHPTSSIKHIEKISKKSKKHVPLSPDFPPKVQKSAKRKNSVHNLKQIQKLHSLSKREVEFDFQDHEVKQLTDSVHLKRKSCKKNVQPLDNFKLYEEIKLAMKELADNSDAESNDERYNSYSEYLKSTFLSGDLFDEEDSFECPAVVSDINEDVCDQENEMNNSDVINNPIDGHTVPLQDHNYAVHEGVLKCEKHLSQELKHFSRRNITCFEPEPTVLPQFIIRTPPFPFVHTPLLPDVAEIREIRMEDEDSIVFDSDCDNARVKCESENLSMEEKFSASILYKITSASSSVLECVENLVNSKHSNSCLPKSDMTAIENDENLENLQKIEKELALSYIAKLHAKKKKRIPDSLMCQICPDKQFTAQATLIHHYRSHAGIKPYACHLCPATFTRQHSLNYHIMIHKNLSRFTCEFCERTFRHPSHYKEHLRRHTGETPYHCTDCNQRFKTRNTFKRHLKTRHALLLTASGIQDLSLEEYAKLFPKTVFRAQK